MLRLRTALEQTRRLREGEARLEAGGAVAVLFTATMFLSATLLFVVQPLFARMLLPLLGGSPSVWNTAQVFYQVTLLVGYLYAHLTRMYLRPRQQVILHAILLLLPLLVLPIGIPQGWTPPVTSNPIPWMLALLTVAVGLPFFVVSTSSPLLQSWFAHTNHPAANDPYFLYAASNAGSMLSLLAYPFLIEPRLKLAEQSSVWALGYGVLVILVLLCVVAWRFTSRKTLANPLFAQEVQSHAIKMTPIGWKRRVRWVMLAAVPSSLMLSVTSYLSSNIAPFPLLWIMPLALYLLTFILVFATKPPIPHNLMRRVLPYVLTFLIIAIAMRTAEPIALLFPLHLIVFFIATMVCHGELAKDRPSAEYITEFYLWMSFGGAVGGTLTAMIAPLVFTSVHEYPLALVLMCLLLWQPSDRTNRGLFLRDLVFPVSIFLFSVGMVLLLTRLPSMPTTAMLLLVFGVPGLILLLLTRRPLRYALGVIVLLTTSTLFFASSSNVAFAKRSFFGINRVTIDKEQQIHTLIHGTIVHGVQSHDPARQREPLTYYHRSGPLGQVFQQFNALGARQHIAVVGLGAGSVACYAQPGQSWTYYEIDPVVEQLARNDQLFTYLRNCTPDAEVVLGDARLTMSNASDGLYDLIVLDAYSSDAIPTHLITKEALEIYRAKLAPHGMLVFHISNRYLDLKPVLAALSADAGMVAAARYDSVVSAEELAAGKTISEWVVVAQTQQDLLSVTDEVQWMPLEAQPNDPLWTDDFLSILDVFHLK